MSIGKRGEDAGWKKGKARCRLLLALLLGLLLGWLPRTAGAQGTDFLIAVDYYSRLYYAASNGDGTFRDYAYLDYLGGYYADGVTIADFNNDGHPDFVAGWGGYTGRAELYLFLNDGSNRFTKTALAGTLANPNSHTMDMASGDFNHDGNRDFIANTNSGTTGVFLGDGRGNFSATELNWESAGRGMDTADFDNDGNLDVVRATYIDGNIRIYWGDGTGAFPASTLLGSTGNDPYGVVAGDFDNDGFVDIIANSGGGGDPYFFAGRGDRTFQSPVYVPSLDFNNHGGYAAFDYNGDGKLDIVAVNYTGRQVLFYPGNGGGTFGSPTVIGTTAYDIMGVSAMPHGPPAGIPTAVLTPVMQQIVPGGTATLDGSGSTDADGTIASWSVAYGDGTTASGAGAPGILTHAYAAEGVYFPSLKVTDNAGKSSIASARVAVAGAAPVVDTAPRFFGEALAADALWRATLDGADYASDAQGILSYRWDLGDGLLADFEDGLDTGWYGPSGTWTVDPVSPITGSYSYRQSNAGLDRTFHLFDRTFDGDITVEADVRMLGGWGEEVHVLFRAQDAQNSYLYILRGRGANDVLLYRRVNGGETAVIDFDLPAAVTPGRVYRVKIVCTGSLIQFYLDNALLFAYRDSTFATGRVGLSTFNTDARFDNIRVAVTATGQTVQHTFTPGLHNVALTVEDAAGQTTTGTIPMAMQAGSAPVAVTGGPYSADESKASSGGWTLALDGSGSTDDVGIVKHVWDFGKDAFAGTAFNAYKWYANGGVTQDEAVFLTGLGNSWSNRYLVTKATFPKVKGQVFEAKIKIVENGHCMVGFKNEEPTNFDYSQFPYQFYLYTGAIYIYENSASRGDTGYRVTPGVWYDFRIELTDAGAIYSYRPSGTTAWTPVYTSGYTTADINLRKGMTVWSGTFAMDDFAETTAGETSRFTLYRGTGTFDLALTVYDRAGQSNTAQGTVTISANAPPVANAGAAQTQQETDANNGAWTVPFDASGSSDDYGLILFEWDFDYDGATFRPSGVTGAVVSHTYRTSGAHTVALRVTDNALQTTVAETTVALNPGNPPVAEAGGPYSADETAAQDGVWTVNLDGAGSTDDTVIQKYVWDFGRDGFDGQVFDRRKWLSTGVTQDNALMLSGIGHWSARYAGTAALFPRVKGQAFEAKIKAVSNGECMFGFKNTDTVNFHYGQYPYAFYLNYGNVQIYEYDNSRGDTGYRYDANAWYDFRIELTDAGAVYAYRPSGTADWTVVYTSSYLPGDVALRKGITAASGTWHLDDFLETTAGATAPFRFYGTGTFNGTLRVFDRAGQTATDTTSVNVTAGAAPTASAGGPYTVNEDTGNAFEGGWTAQLSGTGSADAESSVAQYVWDLGTDTFTGQAINAGKWVWAGNVTQDEAIRVQGRGYWGTDYIFSKDVYTRAKGMAFELRLTSDQSQSAFMIGFKNTGTRYHYDQMTYAIHSSWGTLYIYEDGAQRLNTGYGFNAAQPYEVRIELKETAGARYYYRLAGAAEWTLLYDSNYGNASTYKRGLDVAGGTVLLDDVREFAAGPTPTYRFYGLGSHPVNLTAWDQAGQMATATSSVTTQVSAAPVVHAGGAKIGNETNASSGTWTFTFQGTSTDDHGIYRYEWDFNYDGTTFVPAALGSTATHAYTAPGLYTVALRVTDHALQSTIATTTVTITTGSAPAANAGPDITTEGHWPVVFNGGGSADDTGILKYEWDFGDGTKGTGKTPKHIYWAPGDYTATLTVYDNALQTGSDTVVVHVLAAGAPPVAAAGGPYTAGVGGPPAYLNGGGSSDDHGIVKYLWDVDAAVDSDGDGNPTNDVDLVGRKVFHTYAAAGDHTATLTVVDGAGQTSTATAVVHVVANLPPDVICVPWRSQDPRIPHETYNGRAVRLKGIVRDAGPLTYQWNFGDGSAPEPATPGAVTNPYAIEALHTYPDSPDGTPYVATLTVWDSGGLVGSDQYYVAVHPDNLETRTNIAIDEGLWWLHKSQSKPAGWWTSSGYYSSPTASAIQAFEINGHLLDGDHQENPYAETVYNGFSYLFTTLYAPDIGPQAYGNPDTNGNGYGISVNSGAQIYEGGMVMDAIASSNAPLAFARTGSARIKGHFFHEILTDMVDMYAWGQDDNAGGGGWRYGWNDWPDNSASQWGAIGMMAAEDNFGINVPQWVKDRNNTWLNTSYDGTGFGYTGAGNGVATTPSGMVQLAFADKTTSDPRWRTAEDYIAANWFWQSGNLYAIYALVKALRLARPNPVVLLGATGLDWYDDPATGVRARLVSGQYGDGTWTSNSWVDAGLATSWAVTMLTPALFVQPPVADAGADVVWAFDAPLAFDASGSFHSDPARRIVKYEWDFDGNGTWDFTTADPRDPNAKYTYPDPNPTQSGDAPVIYLARLRVTDDNEPAQTDVDVRKVTVAEPPHAPFAVPGGPYQATAGIPFTLDGRGSYDIDLADGVTRYQWDLDNDGVWFDNVEIDTTAPTATHQYDAPGVYNIGLKVWDKGAFNPLGCNPDLPAGLEGACTPMASVPAFTTVTVSANVAPVIAPNVTYTVNQGSPLTLGGGGLVTDPNGDALTYGWDFTASGNYTGSTEAQPVYTWYGSGSYAVGIRASDSLLASTGTVTVNVANVAPTVNAGPDQALPRSTVTFHGSFTDPGSSAETYTATWNFGDGTPEATGSIDAVHTYRSNGLYTATLTVTDHAGGTGSDSLLVQVSVLPGDVDENGVVELADAILALQIASGLIPQSAVYTAADINGDGKIGIEEALYVLQVIAGLRP